MLPEDGALASLHHQRQRRLEFGITATVIAPGYFRTDFLDPSSAGFGSGTPIADYAASSAAFRKQMAATNHAQEGDPAELGRVLLELAAASTPPVNFPVGPDAVTHITGHHRHVLDEITAWRALSESTSHNETATRPQ